MASRTGEIPGGESQANFKVTIAHYIGFDAGAIGGVPDVLRTEALYLPTRGYSIGFLTGDETIPTTQYAGVGFHTTKYFNTERLKEMVPDNPTFLKTKEYERVVEETIQEIHTNAGDSDGIIIHNLRNPRVPSIFDAWGRYIREYAARHAFVDYNHDIISTRPADLEKYSRLRGTPPYDVLFDSFHKQGVITAAVSRPQRRRVAELLGISENDVVIASPSEEVIDWYVALDSDPELKEIVEKRGWLTSGDLLLMIPARFTGRKEIPKTIQMMVSAIKRGEKITCIVTGGIGANSKEKNESIVTEALEARKGYEDKIVFMAVDYPELTENGVGLSGKRVKILHSLADGMVLVSRDEGFSITPLHGRWSRNLLFVAADHPSLEDHAPSEIEAGISPDMDVEELTDRFVAKLDSRPEYREGAESRRLATPEGAHKDLLTVFEPKMLERKVA